MTSQKGFTIIELLVVIAVLGILASVSIPRIMGVEDKAKDAAIASVAASIRSAMEAYHQEHELYPKQDSVSSWNDLDLELDFVELGAMSEYNIGSGHEDIETSFIYISSDADSYKIEVASNSTGKVYLITNDGFSEKAGE